MRPDRSRSQVQGRFALLRFALLRFALLKGLKFWLSLLLAAVAAAWLLRVFEGAV